MEELKMVKESFPILNKTWLAVLLGLAVAVLLGPVTDQAQAQTRVGDLTSVTSLGTDDLMAVWIVDGSSSTGYRTRSLTIEQLANYMTQGIEGTNYVFYSTNVYLLDSAVSDYFATNSLLDTTVSNYFASNVWTFESISNLTASVVVSLSSYMTNWLATNTWSGDTYVSNYITTNLFNTYVTNIQFKSPGFPYAASSLEVQQLRASYLTVTNGITNLSLNASQYVETDANKRLQSTLNGEAWTNLTGGNVVGAVPQSTHATNADLATSATSATGASYATNAVNLTVDQGLTNSSLNANQYVQTDANKRLESTVNGSGWTNLQGGFGGYGELYSTGDAGGTNFILDASANVYQEINCTNAVNVLHSTNGPGAVSVTIYPAGADRLLSFPTNWFFLSTNNFVLSGSLWTVYATNGEVGYLSIRKRSSGVNQTNIVARFARSLGLR